MKSYSPSIQDCILESERRLDAANLYFGHGTNNAADEALWLVLHTLGISWDCDDAILQHNIPNDALLKIERLLKQRIEERIPLAYLVDEAWFAGLAFTVTRDVLIPRSPIAELIEQHYQPWLNHPEPHILDLCTGSGCIGIASAVHIPTAKVVLSDICPKALAVAEKNILRHQLSDRVTAVKSDLFDDISNHYANNTFDLIVSNPPYVDANDFANMPDEYQAEPTLALVSGKDGLDITRKLLQEATKHLTETGILIVEVGNSWEHLQRTFPDLPFLWLEFDYGGHGVFVLTRTELEKYQDAFG